MEGVVNAIDHLGYRIDKLVETKKRKRDDDDEEECISVPIIYIITASLTGEDSEYLLEDQVRGPLHSFFYEEFRQSKMYDQYTHDDTTSLEQASLTLTWMMAREGSQLLGQTQDNEGNVVWTVLVRD